MAYKNKIWPLAGAIILGFFGSYSFSTRIGLFFVVPLWLKIILIIILSANFSLLGYYLLSQFIKKFGQNTAAIWILLGSVLLSVFIFILAPYQSVPFRTTHHLEITPLESDIKIRAIHSPDDNLISREMFDFGDEVEEFSTEGFRIPPGSQVKYNRAHTGKITLFITGDSGTAIINWDGVTHTIHPSSILENGRSRIDGWRVSGDTQDNVIVVTLPGNTWGQPDLFWALLGGLIPISDFITLTTVLVCLMWFGFLKFYGHNNCFLKSDLFGYWFDSLLCLGFMMVLINVGFPEFIPFWFLLIYLPVTIYLIYMQTHYLILNGHIDVSYFSKIDQTLKKAKSYLISINRDRRLFWALILILAILGSMTQRYLTAPGMIVSGDSVHYMEGARNLAAGKGYVLNIAVGEPVFITGFDPGYSIFLVPGILLGLEAQQVARILNMFLFALTILLTGWIIHKITGKVLPAVVANLFLVMAPGIFSIYSFVMSEPLFIVFLLGTFLTWFYHIELPSFWKVILAGVVCTLMINVRLAGVVFLPVLTVSILIFKKSKFIDRIKDAVIFGLIALIAPLIFFIRNKVVTDTVSNSQGLTLIPFSQENWEVIGSEVSSWFKWQAFFNYDHQRFNAVFIAIGLILLLFIGWFLFRKQLAVKDNTDSIIITLFLSILIYFASIILNAMVSSPIPTAGGFIRYMIPVLVLLLIILSKLLSCYWKQPYLFPKIVIMFIVLVSLQLYHGDFKRILREQPIAYRHYTDRKNECGEEVKAIVESMPNVDFYANTCEYFYFLTGQQCRHLIFNLEAYEPGGDIYQALREGDVIVFADGFGSNPPGIGSFLGEMDQFSYTCYLHFYRWPQ